MHHLPILIMANMSNTLPENKISRKFLYLQQIINRGSYMSAPVLLNLSNELGKSDKIPALQAQQAFSKPCLVNLISKDTRLVFSTSR